LEGEQIENSSLMNIIDDSFSLWDNRFAISDTVSFHYARTCLVCKSSHQTSPFNLYRI